MISKFVRHLTFALASAHIAVAMYIFKNKHSHSQSEEEKLLKWLTVESGVPLIQDMAAKLRTLSDIGSKCNDVVVISYPKSGTTWVSEIMYNIQNNIFATHQAADTVGYRLNLDERVPYLEWIYPTVEEINGMSQPRTLKSHLPYQLIPKQCLENMKIVYVWRNPRDVAVSYYYFTKMINLIGYRGNFPDFFQLFIDGKLAYGDWCSHVEGYWTERSTDNILLVSYEQLTQNPVKVIKRLGEFVGKLITDDQALVIAARCSFSAMKKNKHTNYEWLNESDFKNRNTSFLRNGKLANLKLLSMVGICPRIFTCALYKELMYL